MNTLFLDLENTILSPNFEGWEHTYLINVDKVKSFIENNNISNTNIFSFALHNNEDKNLFIQHRKNAIEEAIKLPLFLIPTVEEQIIPFCLNQKRRPKKQISFAELCFFWGKDLSFLLFIKEYYKNNKTPLNIYFLDDSVENINFQIPQLQLNVFVFNIDYL